MCLDFSSSFHSFLHVKLSYIVLLIKGVDSSSVPEITKQGHLINFNLDV